MILKIGTVYLESNPTSTPAYLKTTRDTMNSVRRLSISALIQILWDCLKVMNYKRNSRMAFSLSIAISPESIIVPIVSCILGFPLLALLVICCLRRRAKLARERARRRNCDMDHGALSLVRFSPVHRLEFKHVCGIDDSVIGLGLFCWQWKIISILTAPCDLYVSRFIAGETLINS
ncbi:uncharacterized protein LOC107272917 isoform X3 [Cephus cinctus]|uniref:Uncharacterized protein LOC107272917 isoform X3 n=1 Tax=Cephus cinctus TaxID=211228 RepID=A0AAJ7W642_CEPCN|nr:uncharacterized protein LOC107272917 isoform X3 [Cephus cinctus]